MSGQRGSSTAGRLLGVGALVAALVLAGLVLFGGNGAGSSYTLLFETGGQLVKGNEVLVAGQPVGTIDDVRLTEDNQAAIEVTLDEPLREGTTAVIRATSLSGVANRYVSLTPGPDNSAELGAGETITGEDTTAPVDLDQLFDVFRPKERAALKKFIAGNATVYAGKGKLANRAYRFINPALNSSEQLFAELSRDSVALERFMADGASAFGAIAERRDDLSALIANSNTTLEAISAENESLDRTLVALAPALRQANTTFVNLRAALDDLTPLVRDSLPATEDLAPFLSNLRGVAEASVPVFTDLSAVVATDGPDNDLGDLLAELPAVRDRAEANLPDVVEGLDASQPTLALLRPYTPDVVGWISKLGQVTAYYDANGHYARVMPASANVFDFNEGSGELEPIYDQPDLQYDQLEFGIFRRCPGGATQSAADGSNPFLDGGNLTISDCDPSDAPPGP